ncbi:NAD-dependent succinate-semialdehyde dehydrogenase [Microbacterium thalassium]|uniref:Succinate-semialdehyde dehydrogenase/glutarate-semialdehyde dehydrogenase n=1 Tax=Microbacterium thalassium TaxID=362649 RepID=A0A7X0KTB6_9MICO|nr:NAD-dependent succinate-semialdehyde dehydrogenase [Microbacterium thalassium]MBB6389929.1 succinate-semialdehyde dehydrogenase/glutarate-semialdehyde dehydrogenase [Microbacterium thalassium]GLK24616.1 NAD-dependent succinate-semialdehyde dehydrogenase [Microbacterium thalassium]
MTIITEPTSRAAEAYAGARLGLFIDGEWREAADGRTFDVFNPATEEVIGHVPRAGAPDIDDALAAAERAFPLWRDTSAFEKSRILLKTVELLRERAEAIGELMAIEQGKPLKDAINEVKRVSGTLEWCAQETRRLYGRIIPTDVDTDLTVRYEPVGVVGAIVPWNFPAGSPMRKMSAAIAAGCALVIKASEEVPATACALAQAFHDAGLPKGVLNLVFGRGAETSERLIDAPQTRLIAFTGSVPVGKILNARAGALMKPTIMELGGHAPVIIAADADPIQAARRTSAAKWANAGQVCTSPSRIFVHESIAEEFIAEMVRLAEAHTVGDPLDPDTTLGSLINAKRVAATDHLVQDAVAHGATVAAGGRKVGDRGHFYAPTVLTNVPLDAEVMSEEPFGPIAPITTFTDLDEAMRIANSLPFGLAAYGFTESASTANVMARGFEAGILSINHCGGSVTEAPSGGFKESGIGRESGPEGVQAYVVTKRVSHKLR